MRTKVIHITILNLVNYCLLIIITFLAISISNLKIYGNIEEILPVIGYVSFGLMLYQIITMRNNGIGIFDFRLWFIILSYLFCFGRIYANILGYDNIFYNVRYTYQIDVIVETGCFIICSIHALYIGMISYKFSISDEPNRQIRDNKEIESFDKRVYVIGTILILISFPFRLYIDAISIIVAQTTGSYNSLFSISTGRSYNFALLFVPGMCYVIASKKLSIRVAKYITYITIGYFVLTMIFTGDRRYQVISCICLMLVFLRSYEINVIRPRNIIWGALILLFLSMLYQLRKIRENDLTNISNFINILVEGIGSYNPILETLTEFGITFYSIAGIVKNIPYNIPFQCGKGFFGALLSILPIGSAYQDFFASVSISRTINELEGKPVGASLIGDFYANYGWWSIPLMVIFGYLLCKITLPKSKKGKFYDIANYYSIVYIFFNLVRSSFYETVRPSFYIYFLPLAIYRILNGRKK